MMKECTCNFHVKHFEPLPKKSLIEHLEGRKVRVGVIGAGKDSTIFNNCGLVAAYLREFDGTLIKLESIRDGYTYIVPANKVVIQLLEDKCDN